MKSIAFCINSLRIGGAEKLVLDLINSWPYDFEIYLFLLSDRNDLIDLIDPTRKINIIILKNQNSIWRQIAEIHKAFATHEINYCFAHLERSNKISLLASILSSTAVVPVIHSINIYDKFPKISLVVARIIYRFLATNVVAISRPVSNYCISELGLKEEEVIRIDNGIDFKRLKTHTRNLSFSGKINFAVLGRLEYVKGYDILLQALGSKKVRNLNWQLKIIGDGRELGNLKRDVNILKISEKVVFGGAQKFPFVYLTDVHFIVMPSRREGLPISLLEALGSGIPVLASDIGVLPEIIQDGLNGYIFESENVIKLTDIILNCLKVQAKQYNEMSTGAKESVEDYSIEKCIDKYLKVLTL